MSRKTYNITDLRDKVNSMIAHSRQNEGKEIGPYGLTAGPTDRIALSILLESVLHETGNYKGFRHLDGPAAVTADRYDDTARHYF
jgi:hypothetical protein